jgi:hypothetical protein
LSANRKLSTKFENRLLESTHSAQFGPKLLKDLVQKFRNFAEKFESRLLGPTNSFAAFFSGAYSHIHPLLLNPDASSE